MDADFCRIFLVTPVYAEEDTIISSRNVSGSEIGATDVKATLNNQSNRQIVSANTNGYPGKSANFSAASAETQSSTAETPVYSSYELTVAGKIVTNGASGAEAETYFATRTRKGEYWIELASGKKKIIGTGATTRFVAKTDINSSGEVSNWEIKKNGSGNNLYVGSPVASITTPTNLEASKYTITGTSVALPSLSSGMEFHVVEITKPVKNGSSEKFNAFFRYDCQAVKSATVNSYTIPVAVNSAGCSDVELKIANGGSGGSLNSRKNVYTPSNRQGTDILQLFFNETGNEIYDEREIVIFEDHLARDRYNFGHNRSCNYGWKPISHYGVTEDKLEANGQWNCHGAVFHATLNDGSGISNYTVDWPVIYERTNPDNSFWASLSLKRGDVVAYYRKSLLGNDTLQHSSVCISSDKAWGANNKPGTESWMWYECSPQAYYDGAVIFALNHVKIMRK